MIEIETERLRLRAWKPSDAGALLAIYAHEEVARYLSPPRDREGVEQQIARFVRGLEADGVGHWAVEDKVSGAMIGRIGLLRHQDWPGGSHEVEVGWALAPPFWGRGLATEGGRASIRHGVENVGLERIISIIRPGNRASRRVAEKCGLTLRGSETWRGDEVVWYAIDRHDWQASATR